MPRRSFLGRMFAAVGLSRYLPAQLTAAPAPDLPMGVPVVYGVYSDSPILRTLTLTVPILCLGTRIPCRYPGRLTALTVIGRELLADGRWKYTFVEEPRYAYQSLADLDAGRPSVILPPNTR